MIRSKWLAIAASMLLTFSLAGYANQTHTQAEAAPGSATAAVTPNFFDPNYWMASFSAPNSQPPISNKLKFNAAHPSAWMKWVDPATHIPTHMEFMNPASYTQFMAPQFYMEFMKPENMAAWMNPASYQVMMDPQTMSYWMNPESYMHMTNPAMYQQTMNPANYMVYLNPNTYAAIMGSTTCDPENPNKTPVWFGFGC
jgi:hypothetical protein